MDARVPVTDLDPAYSSPGVEPTPWASALDRLAEAEVAWLSTVRPDGRPHVTPLLTVWFDGALHFCTGSEERKARNLAGDARCVITTGSSALGQGLDVVVEGEARLVTDTARLRALADAWVAKYGDDWRFAVRDGTFHNGRGDVPVFAVRPVTVFGFAKGAEFSQTRWRFASEVEPAVSRR
jgi:general stress protein 26